MRLIKMYTTYALDEYVSVQDSYSNIYWVVEVRLDSSNQIYVVLQDVTAHAVSIADSLGVYSRRSDGWERSGSRVMADSVLSQCLDQAVSNIL